MIGSRRGKGLLVIPDNWEGGKERKEGRIGGREREKREGEEEGRRKGREKKREGEEEGGRRRDRKKRLLGPYS